MCFCFVIRKCKHIEIYDIFSRYVSRYIIIYSEEKLVRGMQRIAKISSRLITPGSSSAETQKWKNSDKMGISVGLPIPLVIAPTIAPEDDKPSSSGVQKRLVKGEHVWLSWCQCWMDESIYIYIIMCD